MHHQKKDTQQDIPSQKKDNNNGVVESESEQADKFNGQFTDVFIKIPNRSAPFINNSFVSTEGVTKFLKGLHSSKSFRA